MRVSPHWIATLVLSLAAPAHARSDPGAPIVTAEQSFASDVARLGVGPGFRRWAAPGAVVMSGQGVAPVERVFSSEPAGPPERALTWWPSWIAVSADGAMALSSGPVQIGSLRAGYYFTIWRRQADGAWRWELDGGDSADSSLAPLADQPPRLVFRSDAGSAAEPIDVQLAAVEAAFARGARQNQATAHAAVLDPQARIVIAGRPVLDGAEAIKAGLSNWPARIEFAAPMHLGAAASNDLAWAYGAAVWRDGGAEVSGWYLHAWRRSTSGWRLLYAQVLSNQNEQ